MSQRVKTSARGLILPRSSSPENGHLRKKELSFNCEIFNTNYLLRLIIYSHGQQNYMISLRGQVWAPKTSLTTLFIELSVPSQEGEWSYLYMCIRSVNFASFYTFSDCGIFCFSFDYQNGFHDCLYLLQFAQNKYLFYLIPKWYRWNCWI